MNTLSSSDLALVEAALAKMSLDDKLGQMWQVDWRILRPKRFGGLGWLGRILDMALDQIAPKDAPLDDRDAAELTKLALGSVLGGGGAFPMPNTPASWCAQSDTLQRAAAKTASGVPLLIGNDTVHGQVNLRGATIFPHHIGLGCARDADLVERLAKLAALESAACGVNWIFAPCATVPRDLRWGRTYEGFGEDAALVGELSAAEVRGLQGAGVPMAACVKHFVADGATALGTGTGDFGWTGAPPKVLDQGDARISDEQLRREHLPPYRPALRAGALTVMASYSSLNGAKVHASKPLLTDLLRGELKFEGLLVSDYNAVQQCAATFDEALVACVNAGIDMVMTAGGLWGDITVRQQLLKAKEAVGRGAIPPERIDEAVRRILRVKAALGLLGGETAAAEAHARLQQPAERERLWATVGCDAHRATAREAVRKSLVLLKTSPGVLPLQAATTTTTTTMTSGGGSEKAASSLLVCGRAADDLGMQCGGWTLEWQGQRGNGFTTGGTTVWQAVSAACPAATLARGNEPLPPKAADGDVVLVVVGEPPYAEAGGDTLLRADERDGRDGYGMLGREDGAMVERAVATGRRVVVVLFSGRPIVLPPTLMPRVDAFVAAWLPGTEGGGVADVLFGAHKPTGRLSFSWPSDAEQMAHEMRQYPTRPAKILPSFPLGFGLGFDGKKLPK